jgi:carboxyl-terminal processing protease
LRRRNFLWGIVAGFGLAVLLVFAVISMNIFHLGNGSKVLGLIKAKALEPVKVSQLIDGAMKGMVQELQDPYSVYLEPKDYQALETHMSGTYGGLGIYVGIPKETHRLTVMAPIKGTPAARAGIVAGDEIWEIDGKDVSSIDIDTAVSMMKGEEGTTVTLGIKRKNQEELWDVKLVRENIEIPSVEGRVLEGYPGIAYVSISMFNDLTAQELEETMKSLRQEHEIKGLILDLRNNPGGSLMAAVETGNLFVPEGKPVVWLVDKYSTESFVSKGNLIDLPTVVLINKGSASAAEIVAGAIKDVNAGILVGETSFGKGIVQSVFELDDGAALKITTAKYLTPNKNDIHKKGIVPDVEVLLPEDTDPVAIYSGDPEQDMQLKKALEVLQKELDT